MLAEPGRQINPCGKNIKAGVAMPGLRRSKSVNAVPCPEPPTPAARENRSAMRTGLDHLPVRKQRELERIVAILLEEFDDALKLATTSWKKRGRIHRIVLFGSHARGDWVEEPHTMKGYRSDYDLLIIVSHKGLTDVAEYWYRAEDRLLRERGVKTLVNTIVHTLGEVNGELARGQYFFSDIVRDGIALYELKGTKPFAMPQPLTPEEALKMAREHYEEWLPSAIEFVPGFKLYVSRESWNKAAFLLHQAVESFYTCILLVLTNYSPNSHNIKFLRSLSEQLDHRLIDAWPRETRRDRSQFELLKRAYIEARYSRHYKITEVELAWLGARVEVLKEHVETICQERITILAART